MNMGQRPEALCAFPLLSNRCAMREGGRHRRTPAKRRMRSLAALARWPLAFAMLDPSSVGVVWQLSRLKRLLLG